MTSAEPTRSQLLTARLWSLWRGMPGPGRATAEAFFILACVLGSGSAAYLTPLVGPTPAIAAIVVVLGLWGSLLYRSSPAWHRAGPWQRVGRVSTIVAAATIAIAPAAAAAAGGGPLGHIGSATDRAMVALTIRNAAVLVLVGVLLRANDQGLAQVGLGRTDWVGESLFGLTALAGAFVVHLGVSVLLAVGVGLWQREALTQEAEHRASTMTELFAATSVPLFATAMVLAAIFEEIAFRGFVLPRLRRGLRSWLAALLLASVIFGFGHLYEGPLAVVQTTALGIFFGVVFLWRGRLLPVVVAHVGFNAGMMALAQALRAAGTL